MGLNHHLSTSAPPQPSRAWGPWSPLLGGKLPHATASLSHQDSDLSRRGFRICFHKTSLLLVPFKSLSSGLLVGEEAPPGHSRAVPPFSPAPLPPSPPTPGLRTPAPPGTLVCWAPVAFVMASSGHITSRPPGQRRSCPWCYPAFASPCPHTRQAARRRPGDSGTMNGIAKTQVKGVVTTM